MSDASVEGIPSETGGPRCYRHDVPTFHGFSPAFPAHMWDVENFNGACLRCPEPVTKGDRYLCDEGGIIHVTCPSPKSHADGDR